MPGRQRVEPKIEQSRQGARRQRFACTKCQEETDAFSGTKRASLRLCRRCYGKGADKRPRELNHLTGAQWARASCSVERYPDTRSDKQRAHGACFPRSLARQQIEIYTKRGQIVLDPFVGVGTTLDACAELGRFGIGLELNEEFVRVAQADLKTHGHEDTQIAIRGDACRLSWYLPEDSVDFILTSPPYASLLKRVGNAFAYKWREHSTIGSIANPTPYSDHPDDLGNLEYPAFLHRLSECVRQTYAVLKTDAYAVWVVKDFRAVRHGVPYVNFHGDFIDLAKAVGFTLWDIRIYDQTSYRPLVCLGFPSRNFYLNIGHSYLVVLRKK